MRRCIVVAAALVGALASMECQAKPLVFWASEPVGPDETVLLAGSDMGGIRRVRIGVVGDGADGSGRPSEPVDAEITHVGATATGFVVPARFPSGVYAYELESGDGARTSGTLNAPDVYWIQGDEGAASTPGGWVRVFGRNVARTAGARAALLDADGRRTELALTRGAMWDASFDVPADLAPGRYELVAWNGQGDAGTWRSGGRIEIRKARARPSSIVDVRSFGALGDRTHDDGPAIAAAMASLATRGGGIAYLPRGAYRLSDTLVVPSGIVLKGESRDLVSLVFPDFETPPPVLVTGYSDFAIEDLSIFASNHAHILSGGFAREPGGRDGANIAVRRVTIRASAYRGRLTPEVMLRRFNAGLAVSAMPTDTVRLAGANLTIEDCDVMGTGRALHLLRPRGAVVRRSVFYNGRFGWYSITAANRVIFEDNRVIGADLGSSGGAINVYEEPASENVLVRNNHFERFFGGDREAVTTDGPWGFYQGSVVTTGPATLFMTVPPSGPGEGNDWRGSTVFVLKGRGMGEIARVERREGQVLHLDRVVPVALDGSSLVTVVATQQNYLIIDNTLIDAAVAVQFYGTSYKHVAAGNVSIRTGGFKSWGFEYYHPQPNWFSQLLNNTMKASASDAVSQGEFSPPPAISAWGGDGRAYEAPLNYATVIRGNRLEANAGIDIRGLNRAMPGISTTLVEKNDIRNADVGIRIDAGVRDVLIRRNTFGNVGSNMVDER